MFLPVSRHTLSEIAYSAGGWSVSGEQRNRIGRHEISQSLALVQVPGSSGIRFLRRGLWSALECRNRFHTIRNAVTAILRFFCQYRAGGPAVVMFRRGSKQRRSDKSRRLRALRQQRPPITISAFEPPRETCRKPGPSFIVYSGRFQPRIQNVSLIAQLLRLRAYLRQPHADCLQLLRLFRNLMVKLPCRTFAGLLLPAGLRFFGWSRRGQGPLSGGRGGRVLRLRLFL